MEPADLVKVEELLRNEYSLRYKMVKLLYADCPEACFVFEFEDNISAITFNKLEEDAIYLRQMFVREGVREKNIAKRLYDARLHLARDKGLKKARGNMRQEAFLLHRRYAIQKTGELEYYLLRR